MRPSRTSTSGALGEDLRPAGDDPLVLVGISSVFQSQADAFAEVLPRHVRGASNDRRPTRCL